MANPTQRIPLRVLSEHGWNGPKQYDSGNHASAPSIGKPSGGSPVSSQIDSFLVASDALTISPASFSVNGFITLTADTQFANIPITQNSTTGVQPLVQKTNQGFQFTVPTGTLAEYYVWCCMETPAVSASGTPINAIVSPSVQGYIVDSNGIKHQSTQSGVTTGDTRIAPGTIITQFRAKITITVFTTGSLSGFFGVKVFGQLFLTYPSANPS